MGDMGNVRDEDVLGLSLLKQASTIESSLYIATDCIKKCGTLRHSDRVQLREEEVECLSELTSDLRSELGVL